MDVRGVAWLGLIGDHPATRAFYRDLLGLEVVEEGPDHVQFVLPGGTRLEVLASHTGTGARLRAEAPAIGFLVDDVEAALADLGSAGYEAEGTLHEWRSDTETYRWTYLEDPEGHLLQLVDVRRTP